MKEVRYCLQCDDCTELAYETKNVAGKVNGEAYTVPAVTGWHCPACGEIEFDVTTDSAQRLRDALQAAHRATR